MFDNDDNTHLLKWKRSLRKKLINCLALIENEGKPTQNLAYELAKAKECFVYWNSDAQLWEKHRTHIPFRTESESFELDE
jgi:hypothetical protein